MPYKALKNLPVAVRNSLPKHAQEIYLAVFNSADELYKDPKKRKGRASREDVARKVAWAAVKKEYAKNVKTGKWEKK